MVSTAAESSVSVGLPFPLTPEDAARADWYALIARLLLHAPDAELLQKMAASCRDVEGQDPGSGSACRLGEAWRRLAIASGVVDEGAASEEFSRLFIDIGSPQVDPYGSRYLAGFMMEKPLARLRSDLHGFGLGRRPGSGQLEDHLGALCETMRVLITGEATGEQVGLAAQREFFLRHIGPWWRRCLEDIRCAKGANYYRLVADLAEAYLDVEEQAFEMLAPDGDPTAAFSKTSAE